MRAAATSATVPKAKRAKAASTSGAGRPKAKTRPRSSNNSSRRNSDVAFPDHYAPAPGGHGPGGGGTAVTTFHSIATPTSPSGGDVDQVGGASGHNLYAAGGSHPHGAPPAGGDYHAWGVNLQHDVDDLIVKYHLDSATAGVILRTCFEEGRHTRVPHSAEAWMEWFEGMEEVGLLDGVNGWTMLFESSVDEHERRGVVGGNGDERRQPRLRSCTKINLEPD